MARQGKRSTWIATALAAVVTLFVGWIVVGQDVKAAVAPPPAGWTTIFSDDFNGPANSGVNTANWRYTTGTGYPGGPANFGTGEVETMTSSTSNVSLDGAGNLRITPQRAGAGWTSGRIETNREDFQPPPAGKLRIEGRLQMPNVTGAAARGYWPAFWALGTPYRGNLWNWPGVGELDIMENVQGINNEWATMHCGTSPGGPCNEKSGIGGQRVCAGTSCQGGFHVYAVEWDRSVNPQEMRFYLDGANFHTVRSNQVDAGTWANATNHGFFIILNVAMGGEFPAAFGGGPDGGTQPGHPMMVDYVTVLSSTTGGTIPPTSPPQTCGPLISQNRPVTASSIESPNQAAAFAVDGNPGTRWSSAHNEPNWIQVDLGSTQAITRVRLNWEVAYGRTYSIQLSTNGSTWTDAYSTANGAGGVEDLRVVGNARYVRMNGVQRATVYGFSLWEMEVFGACPGGTPPTTTPPTQPPGTYPGWAPNTFYAVNTRVSYSGLDYQCLQQHTSIVTWEPPNAASLWQRL